MQSRVAKQVGSKVMRGFAYHSQFTYFRQPSDRLYQRATLIPGIFIGPEVTGNLDLRFRKRYRVFGGLQHTGRVRYH